MSTHRFLLLAAVGCVTLVSSAGEVAGGSPGRGCGCGQELACGCHHAGHYCHRHGRHRHDCCCPEQPQKKEMPLETRLKEIPAGPVVDSMAVMRISPGIMTMQVPVMMGGVQKVAFDQAPLKETTCETSHRELRELEARIDALDKRTQVILTTLEFQTKFLEELKAGKPPRE